MAIVKRGNVWQVQVRVGKDPTTGRWIRRSATCDTKREAEEAERRLLYEADGNRRRWVEQSAITLEAFFEDWHARASTRLRPGSAELYGRLIRQHVLPVLGGMRLADVSPRHVQGLLDRLGPCRRTEQVRTVLRVMLARAVDLGQVAANAADRSEAPARTVPKRESFTLTEAQAVLHEARNLRLRHLFALALWTGLRRGELCGLRWEDVCWDQPSVTVRRQIVRVHGRPVLQERTKTEAGARTVPLIAQAQDALRAQRAMIAEEKLRGDLAEAPWVFPKLDGNHYDPDNVTGEFHRMGKRAGVVKPLHALRHTTASILLGAGVEPALAAKIMGHASLAVFYATYADLLAPAAQDAARQVERFLDGALGNPEGAAKERGRGRPRG